MDSPKIAPASNARPLDNSSGSGVVQVQNADELRLAQMGHKQELKRHFSVWSLIGLAANCTISWTGLGLGLITAIDAGGPGALIYGFILVFILQSFLAASLAEFVSAYPVEGGMYHWIAAIAPKRYNSALSFATGWSTVFGWIFTTASTNLIYATNFMALIALYKTDLVIKPWMTFHITEEMPNPGRNAPLALACTISIAFVTGLTYLLSLMFSVQDYTTLASSPTGLPLAEIFRQATQSRGGAFALVFLLWVALGPCMIGSQLSTGRVFWAFARDDGLPLSKIWAKVNHRLGSPFNAQLCVGVIIGLLGCIYLGSSTAFNAMMSSAVTINNIAYLVPILTNVLRRRKTMHKGPFFMGPAIGMAVNLVTVAWLIFAIVFFSFPYYMPVTASNMNYTCVCVGGFLFIELVWWIVAGKKYSGSMQKAREEEQTAQTVVIPDGKD
ncbi:hypothetical protein MW887_000210 [Aspergillus wentii]|nr:hypothetical protein MW887_000210 [Aspergillus wentii]